MNETSVNCSNQYEYLLSFASKLNVSFQVDKTLIILHRGKVETNKIALYE